MGYIVCLKLDPVFEIGRELAFLRLCGILSTLRAVRVLEMAGALPSDFCLFTHRPELEGRKERSVEDPNPNPNPYEKV